MAAGTKVIQNFWGVKLSNTKKKLTWKNDEVDEPWCLEKRLMLRQACLGASAKQGERNVVELITANKASDKETTCTSLLSMKVGGIEQCPLYLTLQPPVTFKLALGSGPIHIVGEVKKTIDLNMMDSDEDDEEEEEEEEEVIESEEEKVGISTSQKRSAPSQLKRPAKITKLSQTQHTGTTIENRLCQHFNKVMKRDSVPLFECFHVYKKSLPVRCCGGKVLHLYKLPHWVREDEITSMTDHLLAETPERAVVKYLAAPGGFGKTSAILPSFLKSTERENFVSV